MKRIDDSGRPLYAYLLAQQLSVSQEGYHTWTKIKLLISQLERDKLRWEQAFKKDEAPTWGDSHPAMKLAVLATIVRKINLENDKIEQNFGVIDSILGKEVISITSSYLVNKNTRPQEIHALEPDLLGEWFVLYCFYKGLKFKELLDISWQYMPRETVIFIRRISQDFLDVFDEEYDIRNLIEQLIAYTPQNGNSYQELAQIASFIADKLYQRNLSIPPNIITALEYAANYSDTYAMNYLALLLNQGRFVARNPEKAVEWLQKAVKHKNSTAMANLGLCYQAGEGVEKDLKMAISLYQEAIKYGNGEAMGSLAVCYQNGIAVEEDWNKAIDLYQQAAKAGEGRADNIIGNALLRIFLGEGNYKSKKINDWSNYKFYALSEAPEFDSPLMSGNWKRLTSQDLTDCLEKIAAPVEILEIDQILNGYFYQYARLLPLTFYKNCNLIDIQLYNPSSKNTIIFSAIINTYNERAILLNGKPDIIYFLNQHLFSFEDPSSALDYLRFFSSHLQPPFQIICDFNEIPFDIDADRDLRNRVKEVSFTPECQEGSFKKEGWQKFLTCVLCESNLYSSIFKVFPDGAVSIEENDLMLENLPILHRQYGGTFRTSLR